MSTDNAAAEFLEAHNKLQAISRELAPIESNHLSIDGLGSAGMEAEGTMAAYKEKAEERVSIAAEMKRLRTEAGDEAILAELKGMEGSESAVEYIQKVPLEGRKPVSEISKEKRRGFFGKLR